MDALSLAGNPPHKAEMEYHGKFGHNIGRIQNVDIISRIDICYIAYHLATQTMATNLPVLQDINRCFQYMNSHPNKPIFYPSNYYDSSNITRLTWSGN